MLFQQFHLPQLGHASYLVGDRVAGVAIVVDPQVDVRGYLRAAVEAGVRITHVVDTHAHSDYRSGRATLVAATGATELVSAHGSTARDGQVALGDGDRIELGSTWIRAVHVPGHAPEQLALLVGTAAGEGVPSAVLTGGSLLCGDIGRPDIDERVPAFDAAPGAIDHIRAKLLSLPDETMVCPTHVAGSLCSTGPAGVTSSTIGAERVHNPWLQDGLDVASALATLPRKPGFWGELRSSNGESMPVVDITTELLRLTPDAATASGAQLVDAREAEAHAAWHPSGTLHLGTSASGPVLAGAFLRPDQATVVLADDHELALRVAHDLQRVGRAAPLGWVPADRDQWAAAGQSIDTIVAHPPGLLAADRDRPRRVLDVRQPGEWARDGSIDGAICVSLTDLPELGTSLPDEPLVVACAAGRRAITATSVLRLLGRVGDQPVRGGMAEWALATAVDVSTPA